MTSRSRLVPTKSPPFSSSKSSSIEQEQPHLSGAYIRSLVKQLSSSSCTARSRAQHLDTMTSATPIDQQRQQEEAPAKPQIKKPVRRRTHTSRPYQERLLNMAEARREIVTALKIHRATMRQQQQLLRQQEQQQQQVQVVFQEQSHAVEAVPMAAPLSYGSHFSSHLYNSPLAHLVAPAPAGSGSYCSSSILPCDLTPLDEVPTAMGGLEHLACSLPPRPLGLNLSFQGFADSTDYPDYGGDLFGIPLIQSSSPPVAVSYSSPSMEVASTHGSPALSTTDKYSSVVDAPAPLSPVLDGGEIMQLIGERQDMEWGETAVNVAAASAWWRQIILESMESGGRESAEAPRPEGGAVVGCTADNVVAAGLPEEWRWLCDDADEQGAVTGAKPPDVLETVHADGGDYSHCYEGGHSDDGDDITLPWMEDIGDIEGWDGECFPWP